MADSTQDYLTVYKLFFENFADTVDPDDQLPVRVGGYRVCDSEIIGETIDWTLQYLNQRKCPPSLLAPITRMVIDEIQQQCATEPLTCGYRPEENCYLPLKLMKAVTNKVNEVCLRFRDNGKVASLPAPSPGPLISSCAIKNLRRCMEDRHVIIEDFHSFFNIKDTSPASYYAVFDGHAGTDAAIYSVSHLHQFLAESPYYPSDPERAIKDAFLRTDNLFIEKSKKENLRSGTTAVCALLRPEEKKLYVAWLGDSQAIIGQQLENIKLVDPHKPDRQDEMTRIQDMGGTVLFWGTWRVNGQLAVSRAIGDLMYKPYVTAEPDVRTIDLQGDEDFIVLACDGLWDFANGDYVAATVYDCLVENPGDVESVSRRLVQNSKRLGSADNITVIVVILRDPAQIAAETLAGRSAGRPKRKGFYTSLFARDREQMDLISDRLPTAPGHGSDADASAPVLPAEAHTNPFETDMAAAAATIKASGPALFEAAPGSENSFVPPPYNNGHANGNLFEFLDHAANVVNATTNGKADHRDDDDDDDDDNSEPEAENCSDVLKASPAISSLLQQQQNSNPFCDDLAEELQRQQTKEFDPEGEPARDTPTPPADEVPGVIGLVSDNVAESGEESEDEWNYYRVEPTEKSPQPTSEPEQQTKEEVCQKDQQDDNKENSDDNMESQLNPNAAEFIPSPTHTKPSMEEVLLSQAKKEASMDDVVVPSSSEFEKEVSKRPSDVSFENSFFSSTLSSVDTTGLLEEQEKEHENKFEKENFVNPLTLESEPTNVQDDGVVLDDSAAFSTKAEFGDESTTSFMTTESDFQKVSGLVGSVESSIMLEDSIQIPTAPVQDLLSEEPPSDPKIFENNVETAEAQEDEITFQENVNDFQKEPVHISFELQKEIAPQMESQPERVKVDSVDDSPVEPDIQIVNDVSGGAKTFSEELQFSDNVALESSDNVPQDPQVPVIENFMPEPAPQELSDVQMTDVRNHEKTEEVASRVDDFDLLNDFSRPILDLVPPVIDSVEESPIVSADNFRTVVESSIDDFRENLTIQNESLNMLNNEISTPEYEQLEKVVEASEALMDQINMTKRDINIHSSEERIVESGLVEDVILESAHPDKTELLVDACAEFTTGSLDPFSNLDKSPYVNDVPNLSEQSPESDFVRSDSDKSVLPSGGTPVTEIELVQISFESEFSAPVVNSNELATLETAQADNLLETTRTPPPTPAINHIEQPDLLQSLQETSDFTQAIEKLSVTEHTFTESVSDEVQKSLAEISSNVISAVETLVHSEGSPVISVDEGISLAEVSESTEQKLEEEKGPDPVAVAIAGVTVASVATAAAIASVTEEDSKKENEHLSKKTATSSVTKKSIAEKPKSSAERPKVGIADKLKLSASTTKTSPSPASKLASTTKAKSPTSPVKSSVASKTSRPSSTMPSKPTTKMTSTTKPTSKPPSSGTGTATTTTRTKPAAATATTPLTKPTTNKTSLLKSKPSPTLSAEKKPLTNGDIKTAPKRPEQLVSKTTSRPFARPSTAPVSKTTAVTKPLSKVSSTVSKTTSSTLNGPSKTRPSSSLTSRTTSKVSTDKEIKESANKQISTRTSSTTAASSTVRSSTLTSAKSSATSATRKIESKPLTNGKVPPAKTSSMVKPSTMTKVPPKRPATATRLKSTKTSTLVEKSETVQGSKTVVTTNEVKSEIVIDNNQSAA